MTSDTSDDWLQLLPPAIITDDPSQVTFPVHVPHGTSVVVVIADAAGSEEFLTQVEDNTPPQEVNGVLTGRARFALGPLKVGTYTITASLEDGSEAQTSVEITEPLPAEQVAEPIEDGGPVEAAPAEDIGRPEYNGRNWGVSISLYALRSTQSWGVGDFADLADLAVVVAQGGGDYLMLTPTVRNAAQEVARLGLEPNARGGLVLDPLHIRPEDIREVAYLPSSQRTMLEWGSEPIREVNTSPEQIDFAQVWEAKRGALEIIHSAHRSPMREAAFQRFKVDHGRGLAEYVHAAVAAESEDPAAVYGDLIADSTTGALARKENHERIDFHLWLQWIAREQLAAAQAQALAAGMRIGLIHTAPAAADPQIIPEARAYGGGVCLVDVAAEGLARASELAEESGLWLFADGREDSDRERLEGTGIVPRMTIWSLFANERDLPDLPPRSMLAVAMTEDPPTAGYLSEEHLELMQRTGALHGDFEEIRKEERIVKDRLLLRLREEGLLASDATERQTIEAIHGYLTLAPARFITITLSDAVGNRRPFTLGGDYPDWTYPYTDGAGAAVLADDLQANARFNSLIEAVDQQLRGDR